MYPLATKTKPGDELQLIKLTTMGMRNIVDEAGQIVAEKHHRFSIHLDHDCS